MAYVYVLECADGSLYTGYTEDVARRVSEHDRGDGAKYTRGRTPVELRHVERLPTRSAALSREHEIKSLSRSKKERLVAGPDPDPASFTGDEAGDCTGSGSGDDSD